jgi:glycosyltransferase involved in cell wall biosynthesis
MSGFANDCAISVVIPTFNRSKYLARVLRSLEQQDMPPGSFEVLVVDDGSTDDTPAVLREKYSFPLRAMRQENAGPAAARNRAIKEASGDLLVFVDDDVIIPAPDFLSLHRAAHEAARSVVIGPMVRPEGLRLPSWADWELRALGRQYADIEAGRWNVSPRQFYTGNASVPRAAVLRAGLFDERFRRSEDVELAYRLEDLGMPFRFEPRAAVVHMTPRTLRSWLLMARQYGENDVFMWRDMDREYIFWAMANELRFERRALLRWAARALVGRKLTLAAVRLAVSAAIGPGAFLVPRPLEVALCSALFNVLYWDAAAGALGGREVFWRTIREEEGPPELADAMLRP